jgi:hypothetical protein
MVAKGHRFAAYVLHHPFAHRVLQLVVDSWRLKIRNAMAFLPTLESDNLEARSGKLFSEDGTGVSNSDDYHIDFF